VCARRPRRRGREIDAGAAEAGCKRLTTRSTVACARQALREPATSLGDQVTTDIDDLADRQLVVEAVIEDEAAKVEVFRALDKVVTDESAILGQQHQLDPDHEAGHRHRAARAGDRHPLLQPGAGAAPRRARHEPADVAETVAAADGFATDVLDKKVIRSQDRPGSSSTPC
jgi:3-hydroxybutyryl-CoA dehydrogenase